MVVAPLLMALLAPAPAELKLEEAQRLFAEGLGLRDNPVEARKAFRAAANAFQELRKLDIHNADLFRAEGNAWLLAGEIPQAILAFRRGLRHRPLDGSLREGLTAAREQVVRKVEGGLGRPPGDHRPPWLPRVGFSAWSLAVVFFVYALSWLCLALWLMLRQSRLLALGLAGLLISLGLSALLGLATLYEQRQHPGNLVVIAQEDLPLRLGNGETYGSRYAARLPRGAEARLLVRRGDWLQVELAGGEVGWVPLRAVLLDEE